MRRILAPIMVAVILAIPATAFAAEEVSVPEIIEMAAELAGEEVTVQGELIGDYGFRNDGWVWAQLNGGPYVVAPISEGGPPVGANVGIGIRIPSDLAQDLDPPGGYRHRGPVVRVTGVWRYHDQDRLGESYLEVQTLTVEEPGRLFEEEVDWLVVAIGLILLVAAGATAWWTRSANREE